MCLHIENLTRSAHGEAMVAAADNVLSRAVREWRGWDVSRGMCRVGSGTGNGLAMAVVVVVAVVLRHVS